MQNLLKLPFFQLFAGHTILFHIALVFVILVIEVTIKLIWWNILLSISPIRHLAQAIYEKILRRD